MSPRSKREYLAAIVKRYGAASRKIKTTILNEFCSTCGYHRKHALRLLRTFRRLPKRLRQNAAEGRCMILRCPEYRSRASGRQRTHVRQWIGGRRN
jgi:hypothetical protein